MVLFCQKPESLWLMTQLCARVCWSRGVNHASQNVAHLSSAQQFTLCQSLKFTSIGLMFRNNQCDRFMEP